MGESRPRTRRSGEEIREQREASKQKAVERKESGESAASKAEALLERLRALQSQVETVDEQPSEPTRRERRRIRDTGEGPARGSDAIERLRQRRAEEAAQAEEEKEERASSRRRVRPRPRPQSTQEQQGGQVIQGRFGEAPVVRQQEEVFDARQEALNKIEEDALRFFPEEPSRFLDFTDPNTREDFRIMSIEGDDIYFLKPTDNPRPDQSPTGYAKELTSRGENRHFTREEFAAKQRVNQKLYIERETARVAA